MAQLRICRNDRAIDLVVQQAKQDIGLANGGDKRAMGNNSAVVRKYLYVCECSQPFERAFGDRLADENAWFGRHRCHRTIPATPSTAH